MTKEEKKLLKKFNENIKKALIYFKNRLLFVPRVIRLNYKYRR
jgi:hypothetical protein